MKSLTLKNIPDLLYARIKKQAAEHHRSLNQEVITCLEQMTGSVPMDSMTILAEARALRRQSQGPLLTDERLMQLKTAGRP
ncbi:MAG: FitA-like ribbon-helix-helix domain-containing protein [Gammaproteobacteria bacterium]